MLWKPPSNFCGTTDIFDDGRLIIFFSRFYIDVTVRHVFSVSNVCYLFCTHRQNVSKGC